MTAKPSASLPELPPAQGHPDSSLPVIDHSPATRDLYDSEDEHEDDPPHRPGFADRMFGIGLFGWVRLAALSILVGVLVLQAGVNPFSPDFTVAGSLRALGDAIIRLGAWSVANGWAPLLAGAAVVVPLWLVWRLLSLPFRKPPEPRLHRHEPTGRHRSTIDIDS